MLYDLLKRCTSIFFNLLNWLLGGKLPPFCSAVVVVEEQGRYLVVQLPGQRTVFPGGFMNWRETPQQGAQREGLEETGLHLEIGDMVGCYTLTSDSWTNMSNLSFVFQARVTGGELRDNIEGRPCWLSEDELYAQLNEHGRRILADYQRQRAGRQFSLVSTSVTPKAAPMAS
ncbi:NUDIX hydrolase [Ktedonobacter robiniae]|uniref:Nudix hydrolase domain-containing protein n=1 Tax=Ktedonobacter robiniae TaxID=2778365 RepID=A0ABQ3ULA5_9CHLR|nr:NUDIX hydrolase [Ktedonobacter robiniae]GHO53482.1 hypothetical protein KSB_19570 [Ktedonobacter robiniae]